MDTLVHIELAATALLPEHPNRTAQVFALVLGAFFSCWINSRQV